jgi:hypothetical protein
VDIIQLAVHEVEIGRCATDCRKLATGIELVPLQGHCCHHYLLITVLMLMALRPSSV